LQSEYCGGWKTPSGLFDDNPKLRNMSAVRIFVNGIEQECETMVSRVGDARGDKIRFEVLTMPTIMRGDRNPSLRSTVYEYQSEVELTAAKLSLNPFRPLFTTGTQAEKYTANVHLPYIELVVPQWQDPTANMALNATIRSLLHEQQPKFGSRPIREVSLGFSTDCHVNDYCEAVCSIDSARLKHGQVVNNLQLGPRNHQGGPSLKSILSDTALFRAVGDTAITIKTAGATGLSPNRGFEIVQDTSNDAHLGRSPTTVTFDIAPDQAEPDHREVAALLYNQPRLKYQFIRRRSEMPEYSAAVEREVDRLDRESSVQRS
jgi:hypothetical protein